LCLTVIFEFASLISFKTNTINSRVFFGLAGSNALYIVLAITAAILLGLVFALRHLDPLPLFFVLSGVLVNLLDRLIYGGSVDYLSFPYLPAFNLPDVFIIAGLALSVASIIYKTPSRSVEG